MKKVLLVAALMLILSSYLYAQDTGIKNPSDICPNNTALFACFYPHKSTLSDPTILFKLKNYFAFSDLFDKAGFDYTVTKQISHIANSWICFALVSAPDEEVSPEKETPMQSNPTEENSDSSQISENKSERKLSPLIITPAVDALQTSFLIKKIIPKHTERKFSGFTIYSHENMFIAADSSFIILSDRYETLEKCIRTISGKDTALSGTSSYKSTLPDRKANFFQFFAKLPRLIKTDDLTDYMLETVVGLGSPDIPMMAEGTLAGMIDSVHISSEVDKNSNYLSDTIIGFKKPLNTNFPDAASAFAKESFQEITTEVVALNSDLLKNSGFAQPFTENLLNTKLKTFFGFDFIGMLPYIQGSINAYIEPSQFSADLVYPLLMNSAKTPEQGTKSSKKEPGMKEVKFPVMISAALKKNTNIANMIPENFKKTSFMGYPTYISSDGTVSICHFNSMLLIEKSPGTKGKTSNFITKATSRKNTLFPGFDSFSKNINSGTILLSHKNIDAQTSIIKGLVLMLGEDFREEAEQIGRLRDCWSAVMLQNDKVTIRTQLTSR